MVFIGCQNFIDCYRLIMHYVKSSDSMILVLEKVYKRLKPKSRSIITPLGQKCTMAQYSIMNL